MLSQEKYERRIDYLINLQDNSQQILYNYNNSIQQFEAERDYFLNQLKCNDMIHELNTARQLFDKVIYIDTEIPDFIIVEVGNEFSGIVNINEEYDIINSDDTIEEK